MKTPTEHECFYRGCTTIVDASRYHCDRHEEILAKQRRSIAERNSKRAAEKRGAAGR